MAILLWVLAVVLIIFGILQLVGGNLIWGIVLIALGLLVGPGAGYYTRV